MAKKVALFLYVLVCAFEKNCRQHRNLRKICAALRVVRHGLHTYNLLPTPLCYVLTCGTSCTHTSHMRVPCTHTHTHTYTLTLTPHTGCDGGVGIVPEVLSLPGTTCIFSLEDIMQQLPVESKRYQTMDRIWRKIMASAQQDPKVSSIR